MDLKDTLRVQKYFFTCQYQPLEDIEIALPDAIDVYAPATAVSIDQCSPKVSRIQLEIATPLYYHAGQFVNVHRGDGLVRSYSLASVPTQDKYLELHVKRMENGRMSNWLCDELRPGDSLELQGPNGHCFYLPGKKEQSILLIGTGTGLAPLLGIVRDALHSNHTGGIWLYHGSRHREGLYLDDYLRELESQHENFTYTPCLSGQTSSNGYRAGRTDDAAFADVMDLRGWRVFLCGEPAMVYAARKRAYLAGARLEDIYSDPFELTELRKKQREAI